MKNALRTVAGCLLIGAVGVLALSGMPSRSHADDPAPILSADTSLVSVDKLIDVVAAGVSTSPPSDWIPGIGQIPAILINPPGGPPIIVPTAPATGPWSPWKFPSSWIPITVPAYPTGRVPGIIKWNPTKRQWEFYPVPAAPGTPPIVLPSASAANPTTTITPISDTATPAEISSNGSD